jgi:CheY-like chemotaxis protein
MSPKTIVVVEDDESIAELITMMLNEVPGYTATAVGNGAEALNVIAQVTTDLLILDYELPGLNGIEVYDQLQQRLGDATPAVLFVSGSVPREALAARGLADQLPTPFDLEELLRRATALLGD